MALTPSIRASQAGSFVVTPTSATTGLRVSMGIGVVVGNFPSDSVEVSQAGSFVTTNYLSINLRVSQAAALVVGRGRVGNPRVRAWGYSQDGHDFYVLRLGDQATLVYDATTQQWATWDRNGFPYWPVNIGVNWSGMSRLNYDGGAATEVVVGDDSFGLLWTLDPEQGYDDSPASDVETAAPYTRSVRGALPFRGRSRARANGVWLTISTGEPSYPLAGVTLRFSDDQGKSWYDAGTVTVTPGVYTQEIMWRSLGLMRAPGRLFEFEDQGAMVRIDGADISITEQE